MVEHMFILGHYWIVEALMLIVAYGSRTRLDGHRAQLALHVVLFRFPDPTRLSECVYVLGWCE